MTMLELKLKTGLGEMTAIFIEDLESGSYTAYFSEQEGVVAQGRTVNDTITNLYKALDCYMDFVENEKLNLDQMLRYFFSVTKYSQHWWKLKSNLEYYIKKYQSN